MFMPEMQKKKLLIFLLFIFAVFLLQMDALNSLTTTTGDTEELAAIDRRPHLRKIPLADCRFACARRCMRSSRKNVCHRACKSCCLRCHCVPPGTYGNLAACPCYASLRTHGNRRKCP